jgi:tetratricopeptide (TPR) repeat protein
MLGTRMKSRSVREAKPGPYDAEVRHQLALILASDQFCDHGRASAFLSHVVDLTLAGRSAEIKEATIGVEVYGRAPSYDTKADPIVRSVARAVRQKLNGYYQFNAGRVRIGLPKGSYVPEFSGTEAAKTSGKTSPLARIALAILTTLGCAVAAFSIVRLRQDRPVETRAEDRALISTELSADSETLYRLGKERFLMGDFPGARPLLEKAASLSPRDARAHATLSDDLRMMGYSTLALAESRKAEENEAGLSEGDQLEVEAPFQTMAGNYQGAIAALIRLQRLYPDRIEYVRAVALAWHDSGSFADCLRTLDSAPDSLRRRLAGDAQSVLLRARCLGASGDYGKALEPVRRAAALAKAEGVQEIYARARMLEAGLLMSTQRAEESRPIREEARQICAALGDQPCVLAALRIGANLDFALQGPEKALEGYSAALQIARKIHSDSELGNLLTGIGLARSLTDDLDGANSAFTEAATVLRSSGQPLGSLLTNQGEIAILQGNLSRAEVLTEQAEDEARKAGDRNSEIVAALIRARTLILAADPKGARVLLERVAARAGGVELPSATRTMLALAASQLSRITGDLNQSESRLREAKLCDDASSGPEVVVEQIELLLDEHKYDEARNAAKEALAAGASRGRKAEVLQVTLLLSDASGYAGNPSAAREALDSAGAMLTDRSAPILRIMWLTACGRWTPSDAEANACLQDAIGRSAKSGLRLAEYDARLTLLRRRAIKRDAASIAAVAELTKQMDTLGLRYLARRAGDEWPAGSVPQRIRRTSSHSGPASPRGWTTYRCSGDILAARATLSHNGISLIDPGRGL